MVPKVDEEVVVGGRKGDAVSTDFSSLSRLSATSNKIKLITGEKSFPYKTLLVLTGSRHPDGDKFRHVLATKVENGVIFFLLCCMKQ